MSTPDSSDERHDAPSTPEIEDLEVWAIVVAGGLGARFGGQKQFLELGGIPIVDRAITMAAVACDGVVAVVPDLDDEFVFGPNPVEQFEVAVGGATRSASVRSGLAKVPSNADVIVVHDAARPLSPSSLWREVVQAVLSGADAAIPTIPVTDTIRHIDGGVIDRSTLAAVQTPQAFSAQALRVAHALEDDATDDAALVEASGGLVVHVAGDTTNLKITTPDDLVVAEALLTWIEEKGR